MSTSDAQKRARDKWDAKNKENMKIRRLRSAAKAFIIKYATPQEMHKFFAFFADAHPELDCVSALEEIQKIQKK